MERAASLKRPWCLKRLKSVGEKDYRGWDGWMAPLTRWTWVWASSGSWWWTGKPGMLQSMEWQRDEHNWVTELNWIVLFKSVPLLIFLPSCFVTLLTLYEWLVITVKFFYFSLQFFQILLNLFWDSDIRYVVAVQLLSCVWLLVTL